MTLSLRARITLFFTALLTLVLVIASVTAYAAHSKSRLAQIDDELNRTERLLSKLVSSDLDEGTPLAVSAREALEELALADLSVSVYDGAGALLAGEPGVATSRTGTRAATEATPNGRARRYRADHEDVRGGYAVVVTRSLGPLDRELASLRAALAIGLASSLILAVVLGYWFSGAALRPVTSMSEQARGMKGETRGARLASSDRRDELGNLARAFNGLLDRVESALAQQRQFMADASHELRTPVSVARTAIEVTEAKAERTSSEYRDCLAVVRGQIARLSRLVEDLFAMARADAEGLPLRTRRFYLDELVAACVRDATILAAGRGTTVELNGAEDLEISGDEQLLGRMVSNLLDNAVRHGPAGGQVQVRLRALGSGAEILVGDTNPPITEREKIFDRFVRLDPARTGGGAGLGLSIARAIASAHGGTLNLAPAQEGGNTFVALLPGP